MSRLTVTMPDQLDGETCASIIGIASDVVHYFSQGTGKICG
jgi:hypothetical protein